MKCVPNEIFEYAVATYRMLHKIPEVGFELYKTVEAVAAELDKIGIEYTDRYGKCSLVAQIGHKEGVPTIGFRADMDALPVNEKTDLPFASTHPGAMHACGHDSHTAILLAVAKYLKTVEDKLPCNVRFFFQPSEEGAVSGAKMMVDNGCLEGCDFVAATHCETLIPTGSIGYTSGPIMAACAPITLRFHGITSHATLPEHGVDAVAMAVDSYYALKAMVKEEAGDQPYIWSVGKFAGGDVHNVIPDLCTQEISFRFYDNDFAERVHQRILVIIDEIAKRYGGRAELDWRVSTCPVINDKALLDHFESILKGVEDIKLDFVPQKRSSEDFGWFTNSCPGILFRYGIYNEEKGTVHPAHRPDFMIDEDGLKQAILAFVNLAENFNL